MRGVPLLFALGLLVAGVCGCGEGSGTAPASGPAKDLAAEDLVALHRAMTTGPGMDETALVDRINLAGMSIWPGTGPDDAEAPALRKTHHDLAIIAADVARYVVKDPAQRGGWLERDPESVAIHDAFLAASSKDVAVYRAWVAREGAEMRRRRIDRLSQPPR